MKTIPKIKFLLMLLFVTKITINEAIAQAYDPCSSISAITSGVPVTATLDPSNGAWDFYPSSQGSNYMGRELIYSFTPPVSGKYTLTVNSTNYSSAGYFYKQASSGCNRYSWGKISDNYSGSTTIIGTLSAGVAYYIMIDAQGTYSETVHEFQLDLLTLVDPCASAISTLSCGSPVSFVIPQGPGFMDTPGCSFTGEPALGKEIIYQYTAASSGKIAMHLISTNDIPVMYSIKEASSGCNASGWTCLGELAYSFGPFFTSTYSVTAGTDYYILADATFTYGGEQTFEVTCPETWDPCTPITEISCSTSVAVSIPAGFGAYDSVGQNCQMYWNNPGKEIIYSFTATVDGIHRIEIESSDYNYVNFSIKESSKGCNPAGWSCVGLAAGPGPLYTSVPLTAGTTYYIMLDANTSVGGNLTFSILCDMPFDPCPDISPLVCNTTTPVAIPLGRGAFALDSEYGPTIGKEAIYEFTAAITGTHILQIGSHAGMPVCYFIKEASGGCNASGWEKIGVVTYGDVSSAISKTLISGTAYYLLADGIDNGYYPPATHDLTIICPDAPYNSCASITTIPSCGTSVTTNHDPGIGSMAPFPDGGFPYYTPAAGKENIFLFTPSATGKYFITVLSGTGNINYAIKAAASGCTSEGWTNIGLQESYMYNSPAIIPMELQAGTAYYILADAAATTGVSQTFIVNCSVASDPCSSILPAPACVDYGYFNFPSGNGAYSSSCATNSFDVFPRGSELIFSFTAQETGTYILDGQQNTGINAYIRNASTGCSGSGWDCLGQEFSSSFQFVTSELTAGNTYYIMFQAINDYSGYGYLYFRMGCQANCTIYADADGDGYGNAALPFSFCWGIPAGYSANNNDCNDASDLVHPAAIENCQNGIDDNCDGQVNEGCNLCSLTCSTTQSNATNGTATAVPAGGTPPFSYSWNTVPVQTGATATGLNARTTPVSGYTVVVTDANNCTSSCTVNITEPAYSCGNLTEYTDAEIGGWGAPPNGGNITNTWLYPYFATVFPNGITIGGFGRTLKFNCAQSITNYLPASATAAQLPNANHVNPVGSNNPTYPVIPCGVNGPQYKNTLASKTLALMLNVEFDKAFPNFTPAFTVTYGDLIYTAAPFAGWSVNQVLVEANRLLGEGLINGQTSTYYTTVSNAISNIVSGLNEQCPQNTNLRMDEQVLQTEVDNFSVYPNPASRQVNVEFDFVTGGIYELSLFDMTGRVMLNNFGSAAEGKNKISLDIENLSDGIYFLRMKAGNDLSSVRLVVAK